jgi:hypothetical protein
VLDAYETIIPALGWRLLLQGNAGIAPSQTDIDENPWDCVFP